jgi:hypothetical protein
VDALGREHVVAYRLDQRHQGRRGCADPVGQGRDVELDALAGISDALAGERQVQAVLRKQHVRQQAWTGTPARDRVRRRGRLGDRLAGPARVLLAHVLDHLPLAWHQFQRLGHVLAQLAQAAAAARAGQRYRVDHALAWQVVRQRTAGGLAPLEGLHRYRLDCDLGRRLGLALAFFQLDQLQLELIQQRAALRRLAEPLVPQLRYGVLQLLDLQRPLVRLRFRRPARRPLGQQHRLQRLDVFGKWVIGRRGHIAIVGTTACLATATLYDRLRYEGFIAGSGKDGFRANVRSAIKRTRNKFRACDSTFNEIENYNGFGYCWRKPSGEAAVIQPAAIAASVPERKRQPGSSAES